MRSWTQLQQHGVDIMFEASVGGGIPIISPLKHSLTSNEITSVMGIVNGTTNYMLSRMADDGLDYDAALAEAQDLGYAEADPTADVDGLDAAAKIAILASIAFNSRVVMDQVPAEGIRDLTPVDIAYADEMGYVIKLLAIATTGERLGRGSRPPDDDRQEPSACQRGRRLQRDLRRRRRCRRDDVLRRGSGLTAGCQRGRR